MSCQDEAASVWPEKEPDATEEFAVDFTHRLTRFRTPATEYALGIRFRVPGVAGFEYEVTSAGQTADRMPIYPKTLAATIVDGSAALTCRSLSTASLVTTVSSFAWDVPSELTISGQSDAGQVSRAKLAGGESEVDYSVVVTATCADGQIIPKRCILPVRIPQRVCCA